MAATIDTAALLAALKAKLAREIDAFNTDIADERTRALVYSQHYPVACALGHLIDDIEAGRFDLASVAA